MIIEMLTEIIRANPALSVDEAAIEICMSKRTLQRRLQAKQITYQAIRDMIRKELSEELFRRKYTLIEVCDTLGFKHRTCFYHFAKRFVGMSPTEWMESLNEK